MTKANENVQARNTNENRNGARGVKGRIVAMALAGVLAIGGVSAWCIAGVGKSPGQAPAAAQVATQQATANNATASKQVHAAKSAEPGMEIKLTREGAIEMACKHVGAGGQAKGEAKNVKAQGPITGGGTIYYIVDFDLGDVHYTVNVDVVGSNVISAEESHGGTRRLLNEKGEAQEGTQQPADQPAATTQNSEPGMDVKVSREDAIAMACKRVGAGGQAKGEAKNVKTSDLITGGGTKYYIVDFDLGDVHYTVNVNVVEGTIISAEQSHGGVRQLLDENGNPQEGTQQPVD